jgi:hypothetical protein
MQYTAPGPGNTSDSDTLTFTDDDGGTPGSTQTVSLTGAGQVGPIATVNPDSLDFGTLPPGQTSVPYQVELRNTGTTPLTLGADAALTTGTAFVIKTNTCVNSLVLNPGDHCIVVMQYTPPGPGNTSDTDTLTFTDDDGGTPGSTQTVDLSGTGQIGPILTSNPPDGSDISFGTHVVGQNGGTQVIQVINTGTTTLTLDTPSFTQTGSSDFVVLTNNCTDGLTLQPHEDCVMVVQYQVATVGSVNGEIVFSSDGGTSTIDFDGTGTAPGLTPNVTTLAFGNQALGTTSNAQTVKITNTGNTPLLVNGILIAGANAGDFEVTSDTCSIAGPIAPAGTCSISGEFTPSALGARTATLKIISDDPNSPTLVTLTGTGVAPGTATLNANPTSLTFTGQVVGVPSQAQTITVTNGGTVPLQISNVATTGANANSFSISSDACTGTTLNPNATCQIGIETIALNSGNLTGAVTILSDASNGPVSVTLTANGVVTPPPPSNSGCGCHMGEETPPVPMGMVWASLLFMVAYMILRRRAQN